MFNHDDILIYPHDKEKKGKVGRERGSAADKGNERNCESTDEELESTESNRNKLRENITIGIDK